MQNMYGIIHCGGASQLTVTLTFSLGLKVHLDCNIFTCAPKSGTVDLTKACSSHWICWHLAKHLLQRDSHFFLDDIQSYLLVNNSMAFKTSKVEKHTSKNVCWAELTGSWHWDRSPHLVGKSGDIILQSAKFIHVIFSHNIRSVCQHLHSTEDPKKKQDKE